MTSNSGQLTSRYWTRSSLVQRQRRAVSVVLCSAHTQSCRCQQKMAAAIAARLDNWSPCASSQASRTKLSKNCCAVRMSKLLIGSFILGYPSCYSALPTQSFLDRLLTQLHVHRLCRNYGRE